MLLKRYFKGIYCYIGDCCLNKLDAMTNGTKWFSNPQIFSSALTVLRMLQSQAFRLLNHLVPLMLAPNYYISRHG